MSLFALRPDSESERTPNPPCAVCGAESDTAIWDQPFCWADATAWNSDQRFEAGAMGVLAPEVSHEEACRRYRDATARWVQQQRARRVA